MSFRTRASLAIAAASLLALTACESATGSHTAAEGSLAFTYTGDNAGAYSATGRYNRLRPDAGTYAVGATGRIASGEQALAVFATSKHTGSATVADEFLLTIEEPAVGTVTCEAGDASCPFGAIFLIGSTLLGDTDDIYTSVSGTVSITSISSDRVRGTFSFAMEGFGSLEGEDPPRVQVTSGTFDVPLVEAVN